MWRSYELFCDIHLTKVNFFFVPYVVKLAHFAAIHLKGSPFTVQNGQSFLIFGDSSSVTSHNYIATLVHCLQLPPQVHQNYKTFAQR